MSRHTATDVEVRCDGELVPCVVSGSGLITLPTNEFGNTADNAPRAITVRYTVIHMPKQRKTAQWKKEKNRFRK